MHYSWRGLFAAALLFAPACATAQQQPAQQAVQADGAHDFDWEIGTWRTHLRRLQNPLSGSNAWVEYEGTSIVHGFLDRRANLVELSVTGSAGTIEGISLRLYNPRTRQWSLNYASVRSGELTPAMVGDFANGRGEFYADDTFNGRPVRVRFVISDITENSARFEQAFSADGGQTWEVNWIALDTRVR